MDALGWSVWVKVLVLARCDVSSAGPMAKGGGVGGSAIGALCDAWLGGGGKGVVNKAVVEVVRWLLWLYSSLSRHLPSGAW